MNLIMNITHNLTLQFDALQYLNNYLIPSVVVIAFIFNLISSTIFISPAFPHPIIHSYLFGISVASVLGLCPGIILFSCGPSLVDPQLYQAVLLPLADFLCDVASTVTVWCTFTLNVDRYLALTRPLAHRITRNRKWAILSGAAALAICWHLPQLVIDIVKADNAQRIGGDRQQRREPLVMFHASTVYGTWHDLVGNILLRSIVPFALLTAMNPLSWLELRRAQKLRSRLTSVASRRQHSHSQHSTARRHKSNNTASALGGTGAIDAHEYGEVRFDQSRSSFDSPPTNQQNLLKLTNGVTASKDDVRCNSLSVPRRHDPASNWRDSQYSLTQLRQQKCSTDRRAKSSNYGQMMMTCMVVKLMMFHAPSVAVDVVKWLYRQEDVINRTHADWLSLGTSVARFALALDSATNLPLYVLFSTSVRTALVSIISCGRLDKPRKLTPNTFASRHQSSFRGGLLSDEPTTHNNNNNNNNNSSPKQQQQHRAHAKLQHTSSGYGSAKSAIERQLSSSRAGFKVLATNKVIVQVHSCKDKMNCAEVNAQVNIRCSSTIDSPELSVITANL